VDLAASAGTQLHRDRDSDRDSIRVPGRPAAAAGPGRARRRTGTGPGGGRAGLAPPRAVTAWAEPDDSEKSEKTRRAEPLDAGIV
jgi:hypothetical protein